MKIVVSKDAELVKSIREGLQANDGYCPCAITKTPETKCICKDFIENVESGPCHCGLYEKVKED